jgi:proteasome lid subunit RPN8/RPN11
LRRMTIDRVMINQDALETFLELCKQVYPNENIMLIRGRVKNGEAFIEEFLIPPFSTYGDGFSGFSIHNIPFDLSIIGVAHSHPSGNNSPSMADLNGIFGRLMLIAGYPYDERALAVYNSKGEKLVFTVGR